MKLKALLILFGVGIILVGIFIGLMAFTWRTDVSGQEPYLYFLNTPLEIKQTSVLVEEEGRFTNYSVNSQEALANFPSGKVLNTGGMLEFYAAKSYYSIHVGSTYYLLGRDTLSSGEVVSYEYYLSDYSPRIWETLAEFLERKKLENL